MLPDITWFFFLRWCFDKYSHISNTFVHSHWKDQILFSSKIYWTLWDLLATKNEKVFFFEPFPYLDWTEEVMNKIWSWSMDSLTLCLLFAILGHHIPFVHSLHLGLVIVYEKCVSVFKFHWNKHRLQIQETQHVL